MLRSCWPYADDCVRRSRWPPTNTTPWRDEPVAHVADRQPCRHRQAAQRWRWRGDCQAVERRRLARRRWPNAPGSRCSSGARSRTGCWPSHIELSGASAAQVLERLRADAAVEYVAHRSPAISARHQSQRRVVREPVVPEGHRGLGGQRHRRLGRGTRFHRRRRRGARYRRALRPSGSRAAAIAAASCCPVSTSSAGMHMSQ